MNGRSRAPIVTAGQHAHIDGQKINLEQYLKVHSRRIDRTLAAIRRLNVTRVVELGGHPWAMTSELIDDPNIELLATVSAEESTFWPDDFAPVTEVHSLSSLQGSSVKFKNYSFNVERRLFPIVERPEAVLACELIEHLIRAPHVMLLNVNSWLKEDGWLILSTPNGAQFNNPFRLVPRAPAYRAHCYERHCYVYTMEGLVDLVELCGFEVEEASYWQVYDRAGPSKLYDALARLPGRYFSAKFARTLFLVARKKKAVSRLARVPLVYAPSEDWEHIGTR